MSAADKKVVSIGQKIVAVALADKAPVPVEVKPEPVVTREQLTEKVKRPQVLNGRTYKINVPENILSAALYLTINDITLNEGTEHESRQPFEVFFTSKDTKAFQWVSALSLLISAVFRKGGDVLFLIDELKSVTDPNGGYFHQLSHGIMPSIVAHVGYAIEEHFKYLGLIKTEAMVPISGALKEFVEARKEEFVAKGGALDQAEVCKVCKEKAVIRLDNCPTCTACGDSKCG